MFGVQFYPTPPELARKMIERVDFSGVKIALEPSAGKGDLAALVSRKGVQVECAEIDSDLRSVLSGRGYSVVGNDFLELETYTRYDLIAMNPPFANGETHLLKALDLMKNGGQIVCLLNAETLKNPNSNKRADLDRRLRELGAEIVTIPDAFRDAERRAEVDVDLIYVDIPRVEEADVLGHLKEADFEPNVMNGYQDGQLAENDIFRALIHQYNFECKAGLSAIDAFGQIEKYIPEVDRAPLLKLEIASSEDTFSRQNQYVRELRKKYWKALFGMKGMQKLFTREIRESYLTQLEKFRSYDFTLGNILQMKLDLSKTLISGVEDAIIKVFDQLTYENSMEKNGNIHYYNGWKTNKACKVGQKIIFPVYGLYDSRWGGSWSTWKAMDTINELEKVLTYLDSGRTDGGSCGDIISDVFRTSSKTYCGEWIPCKFFEVSMKKKGTCHVRFTDADLLKKFNIFGANKRGWLPPCYGKKHYADMQTDEKKVVDAFEGKESYAQTVQGQAFYLGGANLLAIGQEGQPEEDNE